MAKGIFVLNSERTKIPTTDDMYDCVDCRDAGIEHKIISEPGPPATGGFNSICMSGTPTTVRKCTGCGKTDGPWVYAPDCGY